MLENVKVLGDMLLVQVEEVSNETEAGIIMSTGGNTDNTGEGVVKAVGEGKALDNGTVRPMPVKAGDRIKYFPHAGMELLVKGEMYKVLRDTDIIVVIGE